jgi:streptogramin lyase
LAVRAAKQAPAPQQVQVAQPVRPVLPARGGSVGTAGTAGAVGAAGAGAAGAAITITWFSVESTTRRVGEPTAMTIGPDANIWVVQSPEITRFTPDGTVTYFNWPGLSVIPRGITTGPDGNLWLTGHNDGFGGSAEARSAG